ncbi:hypothetical protein [Streptomyces albireticuli]|uniref:Uncharacterized protein n=1 Tax=Streptomyces albireticuli TaxID=1940 RepID=A0A2A2D4Y5_9ACTN|nr:hypothetical protein [Streptomyces albireticuli]MCD9193456.1 hypothetical protein [Streptomyces albireticuli]PAU46449.1 hypothetical protein CK936_24205 [Streptomyces albireticuli]
MSEPVFVIHGVGNRDARAFATTVAAVRAAVGGDMELVPVHWGDLGADDRFVDLALPARPGGLRDADGAGPDPEDGVADASPEALLSALSAPSASSGGGGPARAGGLPGPVRDAVREGLDGTEDSGLRGGPAGPGGPDGEDVLAELADAWPSTRWLSLTDDPVLLREAGTAIARAVADAGAQETDPDWGGLRGPGSGGGGLRGVVRRRLADLDRVAGAAMQALAGRVNHGLRTRFGPGTTRFLGDVLVYQRHRERIHARVRERIAAVDPALGSGPDRPVRVVAHSLGGVIAVDMATARVPLWTSSLLTFGSQAAYFHLCDPRGGSLPAYAGGGPVPLPPSLARWTNLWQPLDVLAFAASRVFTLDDGTPPVDVPLPHSASAGLWTHSVYWDLPELAHAIRAAMPPPA